MKFIKMCISKTKLPNIPISNMVAFRKVSIVTPPPPPYPNTTDNQDYVTQG